MRILSDCGSTSCKWVIEGREERITSPGINPSVMSEAERKAAFDANERLFDAFTRNAVTKITHFSARAVWMPAPKPSWAIGSAVVSRGRNPGGIRPVRGLFGRACGWPTNRRGHFGNGFRGGRVQRHGDRAPYAFRPGYLGGGRGGAGSDIGGACSPPTCTTKCRPNSPHGSRRCFENVQPEKGDPYLLRRWRG